MCEGGEELRRLRGSYLNHSRGNLPSPVGSARRLFPATAARDAGVPQPGLRLVRPLAAGPGRGGVRVLPLHPARGAAPRCGTAAGGILQAQEVGEGRARRPPGRPARPGVTYGPRSFSHPRIRSGRWRHRKPVCQVKEAHLKPGGCLSPGRRPSLTRLRAVRCDDQLEVQRDAGGFVHADVDRADQVAWPSARRDANTE